jgi:predicted 3-demethylubiquinone-9 3-methyltransferase (glyoxalase superfamily)
MIGKSDQQAGDRVMTAMLQMKKLDIATLKAAFDGD